MKNYTSILPVSRLMYFFKAVKINTAIGLTYLIITSTITGADCQERDVPYVPTPYNVVERMLDAARVGPGDYVIDLGSGDGRIVIAAAMRGAIGHGVDIDPVRIREANKNKEGSGVDDHVIFLEENIFETDFSKASVITMYLLNSVNMKLRPKLLETLRPGTRIVSHSFSMNDWKPDTLIHEGNREIYYWVVPARVNGNWNWKSGDADFNMTAQQQFQNVKLLVTSGNKDYRIKNPILSGERISFKAIHPENNRQYYFSGRVEGNTIDGLVQIRNGKEETVEKWTASMAKK